MAEDINLRIFTLNCWGIPVLSSNRRERINAIAKHLSEGHYDIACLQEVWSESDFLLIKKKAHAVLPYSHYFHSGVIGSGLCTLSRLPIKDVFFHQWPMNGYMHKIQHGDWFGGKGIGLCQIQLDDIVLNVYTTHLHAEYNRHHDEYLAHRVLQALDAAQFLRLTESGADLAVMGGDLNAEPGDLVHRIICQYADLNDSCTVANAVEITTSHFGTNEAAANSYTSKSVARKQPEGKRIDYILFRPSSRVKVEKVLYRHPLPNRIPQHSFSYSDHDAVAISLKISKLEEPNKTDKDPKNQDLCVTLSEALAVCSNALLQLRRCRNYYWLFSFLLLILLVSATVCDAPVPYDKILDVAVALFSILLCFTLFMCILWNPMEVNAIRATKVSIDTALAATKES